MLVHDHRLTGEEDERNFAAFCKIVESIFHFEFHEKLETLKDSYFPLNPDLPKRREFTESELENAASELIATLEEVLNAANYDEIPQDDILRSYETSSALNVQVTIDMDRFEEAKFYYRGRRTVRIPRKEYYGLRTRMIEDEILERVVLLVRFKQDHSPVPAGSAPLPFQPGAILVKLFKDVPRSDLEILYPDSQVTMTLKDKLLLIVPAVVGGIPLLVTKVVPALIVVLLIVSAYFGVEGVVEEDRMKKAIAALSALAALGGFCLKQWMKYKNKRYQFQKELSDNLYFRNLVNNVGVFQSLVDSAEESECKEAFLAYYFLLTSEKPVTEEELDSVIEQWFEQNHGCRIDFECGDALLKLERLKLLTRHGDGKLEVVPLTTALSLLDEAWDNYFQYFQAQA